MTQNQWPNESNVTPPPRMYGTAGQEAPSRTDATKEEAAGVAQHAGGSARRVAETAKAEAGNVASEAKANAKDLLYRARTDLSSQAGVRQLKAAEGIRSLSSQLRNMADAPDQQGVASSVVRQVAEGSSSMASWLEARDPESLVDEVKTFARRRPGAFLLVAAGAGVLAGRLTRSVTAGAPGSRTTGRHSERSTAAGTGRFASQPEWPAKGPPQETVIAAGTGDHFFEEPGSEGLSSERRMP